MTRLKQYLRNLAKSALLFSFLASLFLSGCESEIKPTYKEENIPYFVKKICKEEYNLEVLTERTANTLWIYAPMDKILDKEYGIKEDKFFDEEVLGKFRNILTSISRVLLSSDNAPEFFALLASDINTGFDCLIVGNVLDVKKSSVNFIPAEEANRRYVFRLAKTPEAVGDKTGKHFKPYDITLADFIAAQIAQRIAARFQDENLKQYFKVENSEGIFNNGSFYFAYSIKQTAKPAKPVEIQKEILDIITYCVTTYEFKDFSEAELNDLVTQDKISLNRAAILDRPI